LVYYAGVFHIILADLNNFLHVTTLKTKLERARKYFRAYDFTGNLKFSIIIYLDLIFAGKLDWDVREILRLSYLKKKRGYWHSRWHIRMTLWLGVWGILVPKVNYVLRA
jgi:hypothetical protein